MAKFISAQEAAQLIPDGATVAVAGMGLSGWAEELACAVRDDFKETGHPNAWKPIMEAVKPFIDDFTAEKFLTAMASLMDKERLQKDYEKYILQGADFDFLPEDMPSGCRIVRNSEGVPRLEITDEAAFAKHFQ